MTPLWTATALGPIRALDVAVEAELLLAVDSNSCISLFGLNGTLQGQSKIPELAAACIAADGSALVAGTATGRIISMALDLRPRWELQIGGRVSACAVDPFGKYIAISDSAGNLHFVDQLKNELGRFQSPRPIQHLRFVPSAPYLACAGDFGWAGFFDLLRGDWAWSDRPVANIGQLAVGGNGDPLLLACFSDGVRAYGQNGGQRSTITLPKPCGAVAVSFDGQRIAAAGSARELYVCNRKGEHVETLPTPHTPTALALSARADLVFCGYGGATVQCFQLAFSNGTAKSQ